MKLIINDKEIELVYSFRSSVYFEQIMGYNLNFMKMSPNDLLTLFYCVVIASLQKAKEPVISMLDFLDIIDEQGGEKLILDFSNWFVKVLQAQYEVFESTEENNDKKPVQEDDSKKKS